MMADETHPAPQPQAPTMKCPAKSGGFCAASRSIVRNSRSSGDWRPGGAFLPSYFSRTGYSSNRGGFVFSPATEMPAARHRETMQGKTTAKRILFMTGTSRAQTVSWRRRHGQLLKLLLCNAFQILPRPFQLATETTKGAPAHAFESL